MILGAFERQVTVDAFTEEVELPDRGVDALTLLELAKGFGLEGTGVRLSAPEDLAALPLPAILHWDDDHYVVAEGMAADSVALVDPRVGRRQFSRSEVHRRSAGVALVFREAWRSS
jgi:ABC-type bacteriocin/lantibiotic exporter with double-glycine peptidase domain